jgi:hypothetical protein
LFLPTESKVFVVLEAGEPPAGSTAKQCTPETKVSGTVAGLITPVGKKVSEGEISFPSPAIKTIDLTHGIGLREPELVEFTGTGTLVQTEKVKYGVETEVT